MQEGARGAEAGVPEQLLAWGPAGEPDLTPPLRRRTILGRLLNCSLPQFPHLQWETVNPPKTVVEGFHRADDTKPSAQGLAWGKRSESEAMS